MLDSTQSVVPRRRALAVLLLFGCAVTYGALFSLNRIAAEADVPPIAYAFWQSAISGIALWVVCFAAGTPPGGQPLHWLSYLVIGGGGIGLPAALLTYIAPHLPVGLMTLVLALSPPLTYLFGLLVRLEPFHWVSVVGIAFGFAGVLLIAAPTAALPSPDMAGWFLLSLVAPLLFASANICAALWLPKASSSTGMATGILVGSALVLALAMLVARQRFSFPWSPSPGAWAIFASAAINGAFIVMFLEIIRMAGPVFFSQFNYLAVVAGIGWGFALFGEQLGIYIWAAIALMFVGVLLTATRDQILRLLKRGFDTGVS